MERVDLRMEKRVATKLGEPQPQRSAQSVFAAMMRGADRVEDFVPACVSASIPLVGPLEQALTQPDERLAQMGANGRAWMIREYSWDSIGRRMAQFYGWLADRADRPAWVHLD